MVISSFAQVSSQFLVLGDWGGPLMSRVNFTGFEENRSKFKTGVAIEMEKLYLQHQIKSKSSPFFVITTGDNFYHTGVQSVTDKLLLCPAMIWTGFSLYLKFRKFNVKIYLDRSL